MLTGEVRALLEFDSAFSFGGDWSVRTPIDGSVLWRVRMTSRQAMEEAVATASNAFESWRLVPPPRRGELIRLFGEELRQAKATLADLVMIETGKIRSEASGEVQEMIDMCDLAVGLSRQLSGLTMPSERPGHRLAEFWHPLGPVAVITAFNFPVAVWAWNFTLACVCGNPVVWKPSEKTPLCALACAALYRRAAERFGHPLVTSLLRVVLGGRDLGLALVKAVAIRLVSATGSCRMGRAVAGVATARFARLLLELGGNNGMIVAPSADLELALRAIVFAAVGTAGQRCTTLRRLFIHADVYGPLVERLRSAFTTVPVGDPREPESLVGPVIDRRAFSAMQEALGAAVAEGGRVVAGGERLLVDRFPSAWYVRPAIVEMPEQTAIVRKETFAPILYVMRYRQLADAIAAHNAVPQGLASSIFTTDLREAEYFVGAGGSDCGIANVNLGPSGAEIGGAFGGEKETGGGREAGSDAWKSYMRRMTATVNSSPELPLAQGVVFDVPGPAWNAIA